MSGPGLKVVLESPVFLEPGNRAGMTNRRLKNSEQMITAIGIVPSGMFSAG